MAAKCRRSMRGVLPHRPGYRGVASRDRLDTVLAELAEG
jgi:hypothetical protein